MTKTFELTITCEDDDYDDHHLESCIHYSIMHREFGRENVEVKLTRIARC
jgi:hypothetical protein